MNLTNSLTPRTSSNIRIAAFTLCTLLAVLVLYRSPILRLITAVVHREGSSHGVFVPFISAAFLWMKREKFREIALQYDYLGIPLLVVGLFFPIFALGPYKVQALSFFVVIAGLIIFFLGREFFKEVAFPLLFLITMIPIPKDIYLQMAELTRDITLGGSSHLISFLGLTFWQEGVVIHLPNTVLRVNLGCSGIRYLVSYFVFSIAYAYLYRTKTWSRLLVILSVFPISLMASILRLTTIFLLTYYISPKMSEYWPHVFISWSVFFGVLLISITSDRYVQTRHNAAIPHTKTQSERLKAQGERQ